jgi:hypothetical protein
MKERKLPPPKPPRSVRERTGYEEIDLTDEDDAILDEVWDEIERHDADRRRKS